MAEKAKAAVTSDISGYRNEATGAGTDFTNEVNKDQYVGLSAEDKHALTGGFAINDAIDRGYSGPTSINNSVRYQNAATLGNTAKASTGLVTGDNLSGAGTLINRGGPASQSTKKMRGLTGAMLSTEKPMFAQLGEMLAGADRTYADVGSSANALAGEKVKLGAGAGQAMREAAATGMEAANTRLEGGFNERVAATKNAKVAEVKSALMAEGMSDEEAGLKAAELVTTSGQGSLAGISSGQLANLNALRRMAGQKELTAAELPALSASYDTNSFQNILGTFKNSQRIAADEAAAAAAAIQAQKDAEAAAEAEKVAAAKREADREVNYYNNQRLLDPRTAISAIPEEAIRTFIGEKPADTFNRAANKIIPSGFGSSRKKKG
jgi:hypothetical protein